MLTKTPSLKFKQSETQHVNYQRENIITKYINNLTGLAIMEYVEPNV